MVLFGVSDLGFLHLGFGISGFGFGFIGFRVGSFVNASAFGSYRA